MGSDLIGNEGGEPACWAHHLEGATDGSPAVVVDLGSTVLGGGGAIWSLPHGGDLDANLVRVGPGGCMAEHVNNEVDVLLFVQSGTARLTVDGCTHGLRSDVLVLIPRGARRTLTAGPHGITYLSVHRGRGPLTIAGRPGPDRHDPQERP